MSVPRSLNRTHTDPSCWGVLGLLGLPSSSLLKRLVQLSLVVVFCLGMSLEVSAKCGSSTRQMIWRNATNAELIRLDNSYFIPRTASKNGIETTLVTAMSHESDRPCSSCHCRDEKQPAVPVNSVISKTNNLPICRFSELPVAVLLPLLDSSLANLSDTFLSPPLGLLERPPRTLCA